MTYVVVVVCVLTILAIANFKYMSIWVLQYNFDTIFVVFSIFVLSNQ